MEVSWSPPADRDINITGYRIFYSNGQNNISLPTAATSIGVRVNADYNNQSVFLRLEAGQLFSELISVRVGK